MDINRKTAYTVLLNIERKQAYSNLELNKQIGAAEVDNPGFVRELVYGVLKNRCYLDHILNQLIPKGLKGVKKQALTLLRMGLYQMIFMDSVPSYAAASETVKLAKKMAPGIERFMNGVLRGYEKKKDQIRFPKREDNPEEYLALRYSYEKWITRLWISQYGEEEAERILAAGNQTPKTSVRVNFLKTGRKELAAHLNELGFETEEAALSERILFVKGSGLLDTQAYRKGYFSIQDQASAFAAEVLDPNFGETVLDICAAPGGKTLAISEIMENKGRVRAFDIYKHKLELLESEAERLGISVISAEENDGCVLRKDLIETADRVLVDGPCSGLGVIRRKPEIKYKVLTDEGRELASKQLLILKTSAAYVKQGGVLLYSTCTVNKIENGGVVRNFLKEKPEFEVVFEKQLLPGEEETDGFYICKMIRNGKAVGKMKGDTDGSRLQD